MKSSSKRFQIQLNRKAKIKVHDERKTERKCCSFSLPIGEQLHRLESMTFPLERTSRKFIFRFFFSPLIRTLRRECQTKNSSESASAIYGNHFARRCTTEARGERQSARLPLAVCLRLGFTPLAIPFYAQQAENQSCCNHRPSTRFRLGERRLERK